MDAYEVVISGSYRTIGDEYIDFQDVKGVVPRNVKKEAITNSKGEPEIRETSDAEFAEAMIRKRYAAMWLTEDKKYPQRIKSMREVHIDNKLEDSETIAEFSFVGKDITKLTFGELQDLASAKDLRAVPLYKKTSLRNAQTLAYVEYAKKILSNKEIDHKVKGFNVAHQTVILCEGGTERNIPKTFTNDEILDQETDSTAMAGPKSSLSRDELEQLATEKDVMFHPNISDENLYNRLFVSA